jgi:hypothetical protein
MASNTSNNSTPKKVYSTYTHNINQGSGATESLHGEFNGVVFRLNAQIPTSSVIKIEKLAVYIIGTTTTPITIDLIDNANTPNVLVGVTVPFGTNSNNSVIPANLNVPANSLASIKVTSGDVNVTYKIVINISETVEINSGYSAVVNL